MSKVLITGSAGMVGSAFKNIKSEYELVHADRNAADLLEREQFMDLLSKEKPDCVIHLAAKVGGVKGNTDFVSDFYSENVRINCNVLDSCNSFGVKKVVSLLSTCVYPDKVKYPLTEDQVHNGEPHVSNFGYAYAKRMLDIQSRALRSQYGRDYVCAIPNNLYGPHDNFDLNNGHVIPSVVRKIWEAKTSGKPPVFWGDGSPLREFTYSEDIAAALLFILKNYSSSMPINIGCTNEISIEEVVQTACELLNYDGNVLWDTGMPKGQHRKPSSNSRFKKLGWKEKDYTGFRAGMRKTIDWFVEAYPNVRGI